MPSEQNPILLNSFNYDQYQSLLPQAILVASKFPSNDPLKVERLEVVDWYISVGADPLKEMELYGETTTPLKKAQEWGDPQVLKTIKAAMERRKKAPPIIIIEDPDMAAHLSKTTKKEPALPVGLIFPGQGSQYVKMLSGCKDMPECQEIFQKANDVLGYDILDLCLKGPEEKLEETKYCQLAVHVANLCAVEVLKKQDPDKVSRCKAVAGLSLGEYTALTVAGFWSLEISLSTVKFRAETMQEAAKKSKQAMLSVAGLDQDVLEELCKDAAKKTNSVCAIANFLFPKGFSCAGSKQAIELLEKTAKEKGALQARQLKTSGAFHTEMMKEASTALERMLKAQLTKLAQPKIDIFMNSTGEVFRAGTDPREIAAELVKQVYSPVKWQQCINGMIEDGVTEFYECGPMKQLKAMMKRTNQGIWDNTHSIEV